MFDLINGIPVHPLVVHAIVVLLPLATLGTLAIVAKPSWRLRYGPVVIAAALVSTVLMPVATSSGEELEKRVGEPGDHAELGDQLIFFAIPLLVTCAALVWLEWKRSKAAADGATAAADAAPSTLIRVVAGLAVVAALASVVQVYRVGDSGAKAAWGDVPASRG